MTWRRRLARIPQAQMSRAPCAVLVGLLLAAFTGERLDAQQRRGPPNIVLIQADDLGYAGDLQRGTCEDIASFCDGSSSRRPCMGLHDRGAGGGSQEWVAQRGSRLSLVGVAPE